MQLRRKADASASQLDYAVRSAHRTLGTRHATIERGFDHTRTRKVIDKVVPRVADQRRNRLNDLHRQRTAGPRESFARGSDHRIDLDAGKDPENVQFGSR